jgi:cytochrome P450
VAPCEYLAHRRADLWDAPLAFRPERFRDAAEAPRPPAYFPFGFGARACLGAIFVPRTLLVALDAVLARFALAPAGDWPRTVRHGTLLAPAEAAGLVVTPTSASAQEARPC